LRAGFQYFVILDVDFRRGWSPGHWNRVLAAGADDPGLLRSGPDRDDHLEGARPRLQAAGSLWFAGGFGLIIFLYVVFTSSSTPQVAATLGLSLVQIAAALTLARITAYKLAD
jgi:hypothetical protein